MKPKAPSTPRGRTPKGKIIKKELPNEENINNSAYNGLPSVRPSVEIVKCISYQKFRYSGENRPGKKYQEKEFMTLKLSYLQDKVVRVVIICTDADNRELIHPNGLVGKDCHDGIYDKEYAVTKQFFIIKIPYLRTERMKTKKNEHRNILGVLSSRASHLPSPYKERCLSQCTDKYTSSREKFDTTKVCLGVIVTVESHQGVLNGSLHAISHVVRNASEKTSLSILKLSNDSVPALTGAFIDIFTTEDGPAIEPDKYLVSVSYESDHGADSWHSEKHTPGKTELLYKRVITYQIPPFEPNPNIATPVEVNLHLECPQSNQYCSIKFKYIPHGEMMILDEQGFHVSGQKRGYVEHDIKPSPKKLRTEMYENDGSTESIKANLKTKIKARNETPNSIGTLHIDPEEEETTQYTREHKQHKVYPQECAVLIHHQDPHTGESSYLLDMDANKSNSSSSNSETAAYVGENQYVTPFREKNPNHLQVRKNMKVTGTSVQANHPDFKVVATGYSDTVPADTVLVYTTNGIMQDRGDDGSYEHLLIQAVSEDNQMVFTHSPNFRHGEKHVNIFSNDGVPTSAIHKGSSAQNVRGENISERRSSNFVSELVCSDGRLENSQSHSGGSVPQVDNMFADVRISHNDNVSRSVQHSSSYVDRYSSIPTSFSSTIPPIRRMLIPSKAISSASPWEVDNGDDSASEYNIVVKTFEASNNRAMTLKNESMSNYHVRIAEKQFHHLGGNSYNKDSGSRDNVHTAASEESVTGREENDASNSAGLSSIEVAEAINNLPTMKIFEIAEHLEDSISEDAAQNK